MISTSSTPTLYYYSVASRRTPGHPKKSSALPTAKSKSAATSSFKRRRTIRSKAHYETLTNHLQKSSLPTIHKLKQPVNALRSGSFDRFFPAAPLISLEEAARRPELVKRILYEGQQSPLVSPIPINHQFPTMKLISLSEAACHPELTKRLFL